MLARFMVYEIEHGGDVSASVADLQQAGCRNVKVLAMDFEAEHMSVECEATGGSHQPAPITPRGSLPMKSADMQREALSKAASGQSLANYPAIIEGFVAKGIPEEEIRPRENVFTFHAWKALGRHVRKGEHGVKVITRIACSKEIDTLEGKQTIGYTRPWTTTVFHVSQTEPIK